MKPQDNFGGLLSSDKLKGFASANDGRNDFSVNFEYDFSAELSTIKNANNSYDYDSQDRTIRPIKKVDQPLEGSKSHHRTKSSTSKMRPNMGSSKVRSPTKSSHLGSKFELLARPDVAYREHSVEDYSDLFIDNDNVFNHRVNQAVNKVWETMFSILFGEKAKMKRE